MELIHLRAIVEGLDSLAEIEKEHPVLGRQLLTFVGKVHQCCEQAYQRLSDALAAVRKLPSKPSDEEIEEVCKRIDDAPSSRWFKDVSRICDKLAAIAKDYDSAISEQVRYAGQLESGAGAGASYRIDHLLSLLHKHETDLRNDIRSAVATVQAKLGQAKGTQDVEEPRQYALRVQEEISDSIDQINKLSLQIAAGSSKGVSAVLPEQIAEGALKRPERVLILNMFFVLVVAALGATIFQFLKVYQFVLVTGFAMTTVVVVNALYLRTIDKLDEQNFLELMQLALLKFFAPLTRRGN